MSHDAPTDRSSNALPSHQLHSRRNDVARVVVVHTALDAVSALTISSNMKDAGYDTAMFEISRTVVDHVADDDPDIVLVVRTDDSINLPRLCSELHEVLECRTLVIDFTTSPTGMLSPAEEVRIVETLEAGADDYLSGQGSSAVLLARVRVGLRARPAQSRQPRQIEIGDVVIDVQAHAVLVAGNPVKCRPRQFDLLVALATRPNELVRTETLIASVWGVAPDSVDSRRVRIAVSVLRRVLGSGPHRATIESEARLGYRLIVPASAPYTSQSN